MVPTRLNTGCAFDAATFPTPVLLIAKMLELSCGKSAGSNNCVSFRSKPVQHEPCISACGSVIARRVVKLKPRVSVTPPDGESTISFLE